MACRGFHRKVKFDEVTVAMGSIKYDESVLNARNGLQFSVCFQCRAVAPRRYAQVQRKLDGLFGANPECNSLLERVGRFLNDLNRAPLFPDDCSDPAWSI